jgi:hypothetical protein
MSDEAKHTPGPWQYRRFDAEIIIETCYGAEDICGIHNAFDGDLADRGEEARDNANARLIAAAPDLLALAEMVIARLHDNVYEGVRPAALAAVAKVKGTS